MKKIGLYGLLLVVMLMGTQAPIARADEGSDQKIKQEKGFEVDPARPVSGKKAAAPVVQKQPEESLEKAPKRWRLFGSSGYEYDDNVPLVTNHKALRTPGDKSAGRYRIEAGLGYDLYRSKKYRAEVSYRWGHDFHDDSLNQENLQDHILAVAGHRYLKMWDRPSRFSIRYRYVHNILGGKTFNSFSDWTGSWVGEWKENFVLSVYDQLAVKNFRDKGFFANNSSRNGLYHRTGFIQRYLFDNRKREINAGYEFGFDATKGNNYDQIENGVRVGLVTPVIEKVKFETNFYFQDGYYHHYSRPPRRHDLRYNYEFILSRPFGKYVEIEGFYKRTDVNTLNDGMNGVFNYDRNIYGFRMNFNY